MTPKERAAMQQALEACEVGNRLTKAAIKMAVACGHGTIAREMEGDTKFDSAITAMREALAEQANNWPENEEHKRQLIEGQRKWLAEPDMNLNCKSVQARLATLWGYVKAEQAEQEPVENKIYTQTELDAAVLAEREACAKVCDDGSGAYVNSDYTKGLVHGARLCAAAIRARGEK